MDTTTIHSNFEVRVTVYTDSTSDNNFSILKLSFRLRKSVLSQSGSGNVALKTA